MSRLTPLSRLLIVLVIVAAVIFGVRHFFPGVIGSADNADTTTETMTDSNVETPPQDNTATENDPPQADAPVSSFAYTAPQPVGGKLKGVVELGATGFNSFVVNIDAQKNWELKKADYGSSLVYEQLTSDADITAGLKNYIAEMLAFGVGGKDIHFVISSGAQKVEITSKIIKALKGLGYVVNTVTPEKEGQLAFKSAMPSDFKSKAFVVDIGSGNTKISWLEGGNVKAVEAYGAKYFQNNLTDNEVYQNTVAKAKMIPANLRNTCFIIGGVPFELAKQVRSGKERYTVLKMPIDYKAEGEKQKAGLNIYKAIADATGCQQFVFDWDANFTIGFLLNI